MRVFRSVAIVLALLVVALFLACVWIGLHVSNRWPAQGTLVQVEDAKLHYVRVGARSDVENSELGTIVFIHGASSNLRDLKTPLEKALVGRADMIFVDRPGHGYSTRPNASFSNPVIQARLIAGMLDELHTGPVTLVAHSWGTSVALALTVFHPEKVSGLMLLTPASHPWEGGVEWYYKLTNTPVLGEAFAYLLAPIAGWFRYQAGTKSVFAPNEVPDDYEETSGTRLVLRSRNFLNNARDVANLNANIKTFYQRYSEISVPTAIIAGSEDVIVTNALHAAGLKRDIKGSRLSVMEGIGHKPDYHSIDEIVRQLEWIRQSGQTKTNE